MKKQLRQQVVCAFGKFKIAVVDYVDEHTEYYENGQPKDGYGTAIEIDLSADGTGNTTMAIHDLINGDFRKIANMFTLLAAQEEAALETSKEQ